MVNYTQYLIFVKSYSFPGLPIGLRLVLTHAVKGVAFTRFRWFYGLAF